MNKKEFEAIMKRNGDTQQKLAEAIGISRITLNNKINERKGAVFTAPEIAIIKKRYSMRPEDVELIFFSKSVS